MDTIRNSSGGQVSGTLIQIGTLNGSVDLGQQGRRGVRLLPAVTSAFQNRTVEFAELDGWAEEAEAGGRRLWNITGSSGIGKTTLALTWINENRHRFGHAQIAMECGGGSRGGRGRGIEEVCDRYFALTGFVTEGHALGTPAAKIDLFRSLIEERPVVLLLDDVQSAAQVRPFLSNLPGLLVIVTSRVPLPGLAQDRPRRLDLAPMTGEALADLLVEILDEERTAAEPRAFAELVALCTGSPLVAGHAAGLLHDRPNLPIGGLVARMAEHGRLTAIEDGDDDTMARPSSVFDVSYAELGPDGAEVYRAIGLHPTRDFDSGLIPALFPDSPERGEAGLRELLRRGLVKADRRGRSLMDDLTHEHAATRAHRSTGPGERARIRERIADHYLHGAVAADTHLSQRWRLGRLYGERPPFPPPDFAAALRRDPAAERSPGDPPAPMEWIGDNLAAIMSCMERSGRIWDGSRPAPGYRWQMAEATNAYFTANGRGDERATILAWAEQDALACEDADAQARVQAQWGEMLLGQGRPDEAEKRFRRSLEAAEAGADPRGVGAALEWLGITERRRGRPRRALEYLDRSRPFLDPARRRSHALHHMHRADAYAVLGDRPAALECYAASMACFREYAEEGRRDHANEGKVLMGQGRSLAAEHPDQARALFEEAVTRFRAAQRPYQEGKAVEALGDLGGGDEAAGRYWQAALDLYARIGNAGAADRVRAKLGRTG
ncbi:tetratricopeptide (TPR) repeat protein [Spinactinospora alkalitolerans]|uniref:Tetratricopeptide (TPR) repeat protein n=1 Tax=Spinactinospora alkalitolerans TaxID=687207 RepID=A0A852TUG1_9ACTN|nr:tetratricopeptide repeat protein [Spinactinospora alkalitolerans]NYE47075.1 tetratricopeptide (TPR) repeat protein [Spinactinospora alkalitolerans]